MLKERRLKLLGHVICAEADDSLKEVTFNRNTMEIKSVGFRRVGRPKTHWIHTVMETSWEEIKHLYPDEIQEYDDLHNQKQIIKQTAEEILYPFTQNLNLHTRKERLGAEKTQKEEITRD